MVRNRQAVQQLFPLICEPNMHFTLICFRRYPLHHSVLRQPVHQFNGAVMTNQHPRCELANSRFNAIRQAFDCQQELMLLRLNSVGARLIFAKPQEPADLIAKFSQVLELTSCKFELSLLSHMYRITTYLHLQLVGPARDLRGSSKTGTASKDLAKHSVDGGLGGTQS